MAAPRPAAEGVCAGCWVEGATVRGPCPLLCGKDLWLCDSCATTNVGGVLPYHYSGWCGWCQDTEDADELEAEFYGTEKKT